MRLFDYVKSSEDDRSRWMESFKMTSGLPYFGGKQFIGKYLMNRIFNMADKMDRDGKHADIFIDGFTGGGKIGLSVPDGWFGTIVMNDFNYGIYSFFNCCKEKPMELYKMIEKMSKIFDKEVFTYFVYNRSNYLDNNNLNILNNSKYKNKNIDKLNNILKEAKLDENEAEEIRKCINLRHHQEYLTDVTMNEVVAGAMTYFVTHASYNGQTDPIKATYKFISGKETDMSYEKDEIEKIVKSALKRIPEINKLMNRNNIIIENLDYKELIKKYNGKEYTDLKGNQHVDEEYASKIKLWYFDPPYHPATLAGGKSAPYEDTFSVDNSRELVEILHGGYGENKGNKIIDTYGTLEYFIKSDYSIRYALENLINQMHYLKKLNPAQNEVKKSVETEKKTLEGLIGNVKKYIHDFDCLEENEEYVIDTEQKYDIDERESKNRYYKPNSEDITFYVEKLGDFKKAVKRKVPGEEGTVEEKVDATEFIWCRGNYSQKTLMKEK